MSEDRLPVKANSYWPTGARDLGRPRKRWVPVQAERALSVNRRRRIRSSVKPFLRTKCTTGLVVLAEGLHVFRLRVVATSGRKFLSSNLCLEKELWLDGCLGVEPRYFEVSLPEGLCDWGLISLRLKASVIWGNLMFAAFFALV
jgi:hypothetical protein